MKSCRCVRGGSSGTNDQRFRLLVTYIDGSISNPADLERAGAASAKAVFVLSNKFSASPVDQDAATIMIVFAIRRFVQQRAGRNIDVHVQLIKPASKQLYLFSCDGDELVPDVHETRARGRAICNKPEDVAPAQ